ncbi:hypothetical protein IG631_10879 [Alternaria alternata]|nr:hypothetical protein IG631_10879 [Alternaria alternata]
MPPLYTYVLHTQPSASWHLHITSFAFMTLEHRCHTCLGMNLPAPPSPRYSRHRHGDQYALEEPRPEHVWFNVSSHQGSRGFRNLHKTSCGLFAPRASLLDVMTACGVVDHRSGGRERRLDRPF